MKQSKKLIVKEINGGLYLDSVVVAESYGIEHSVFMETLNKLVDTPHFGKVLYETCELTAIKRYALLNEDQIIFLGYMVANTKNIVKFKVRMTIEFSNYKKYIGLRNKLEFSGKCIEDISMIFLEHNEYLSLYVFSLIVKIKAIYICRIMNSIMLKDDGKFFADLLTSGKITLDADSYNNTIQFYFSPSGSIWFYENYILNKEVLAHFLNISY